MISAKLPPVKNPVFFVEWRLKALQCVLSMFLVWVVSATIFTFDRSCRLSHGVYHIEKSKSSRFKWVFVLSDCNLCVGFWSCPVLIISLIARSACAFSRSALIIQIGFMQVLHNGAYFFEELFCYCGWFCSVYGINQTWKSFNYKIITQKSISDKLR